MCRVSPARRTIFDPALPRHLHIHQHRRRRRWRLRPAHSPAPREIPAMRLQRVTTSCGGPVAGASRPQRTAHSLEAKHHSLFGCCTVRV